MRHTHSNRYIYVTNESNKTFNSLKEFMLDQGLEETLAVIYSGEFYRNIVHPDGSAFNNGHIGWGEWESSPYYEFRWKNPESGEIFTLRRMKRFRSAELA